MGMIKLALSWWLAFARTIGVINTHILLSSLFFAVLTPLGLLSRLFGKSPFSRPLRDTLWEKRVEVERLERQF